jgi:hypothetical protein
VVDSHSFAEFVAALERRRPEVNMRNIDCLRSLCSEFGLEETLSALKAFEASPPYAGVSSIEDESRRRVRDVEEKSLQLDGEIGRLQQEVCDLCEGNVPLTAETRA